MRSMSVFMRYPSVLWRTKHELRMENMPDYLNLNGKNSKWRTGVPRRYESYDITIFTVLQYSGVPAYPEDMNHMILQYLLSCSIVAY